MPVKDDAAAARRAAQALKQAVDTLTRHYPDTVDVRRLKADVGRLTGRARDNRLVHLAGAPGVRPGDVVETVVTKAGPHYLVADGPLLSHRRTAAGDAWEGGRTPSTPGVSLGMPGIGVPAPLPAAPSCA